MVAVCLRLPVEKSVRVLVILALIAAGLAAQAVVSKTASAAPVFTDVNPDVSSNSDADASTGGRVNRVASVPGNNQIFYAASEQGGIFKTTNGTTTWTHLDGHVPQITWDVDVNPGNVNTVYATSFYDGKSTPISGIEVSTNAGATWAHPASATPDAGAHCAAVAKSEPAAFGIGIRPDDTTRVFIGTNCGVARSTDSGATWNFVDPTPATTNANKVWDVRVVAGGANGTVHICGDDGFFRSTDGGATWIAATTAPPQGICSLSVSPDESYVLFATASDNNTWESDDGGANWTNIGNFGDPGQGRIPFVTTNKRATNFDLWFGDVELRRVACTTPAMPAQGGASRCAGGGVAGPFTRAAGAHDDAGFLVFDTAVAVDACPRVFTSDGGAHINTLTVSPACQTPAWNRSNAGLHGLWVFGMSGTDQAGATNEGLFFGAQDNGTFASVNAGANPPTWTNPQCCDTFDAVSDASRTVFTNCCFNAAPSLRMFLGNASGGGLAQINTYPPGSIVGFRPPSAVVQFGATQYAVLTSSGLFFTNNITANPIVWSQIGAASSPGGACAVYVAVSGGTPTFFLQTNGCGGVTGDQVWRFTGTGAGTWTRIDNTDGVSGGFSIFAVDPSDPNRLYAANLAPGGPRMIRSNNSGTNWVGDVALDARMTGGGAFRYSNSSGPTAFTGTGGYAQPTLVAFDPQDTNTIVAAGHDSGLFMTRNNGATWDLMTDPINPGGSGIPHLPQPRFAYFDHEGASLESVYIGTAGRGVWRLVPGKSQPTIATNATSAPAFTAANPPVITDTATLATGTNPTGSLTFQAFAPGNTTCSGAPVFSSIVPVNGNGAYVSGPFNAVAEGDYRWTVTYSGDSNNFGALSPCNAANETSNVTSICSNPPPPGTLPGNNIVVAAPGDVLGTAGNDVIYGSPGVDRITGQGGNDIIFAGAGDDQVTVGAGLDTVCGQDGNDWIFLNGGNDLAVGGLGNDRLSGGDGNDRLIGGPGKDMLTGDVGTDTCTPGTDPTSQTVCEVIAP